MRGGKEEDMFIFECKIRVKLKCDMMYPQISEKVTYYIDHILAKKYLDYHNSKEYKSYVHDMLWPIEEDGVYKQGRIYTFRIRTINQELAEYFVDHLSAQQTKEFMGVSTDIKILPKKFLSKIYSITPVVIKNPEFGYWRGHMTVPEFEERIKINLIKKYRFFTGKKLDDDFEFCNLIEFSNKQPIKIPYKKICLLGDKICFHVASNPKAQMLAQLALGVGTGENCSRGNGFMNYQYM